MDGNERIQSFKQDRKRLRLKAMSELEAGDLTAAVTSIKKALEMDVEIAKAKVAKFVSGKHQGWT